MNSKTKSTHKNVKITKRVPEDSNRRKCMMCNAACWRSDVYYCWECYKYQMYESR